MKKIFSLFVCVVLAGAIFAGCGKSAEKGGKLVIYTPHNEEHSNALIKPFEEETGIKVEIIAVGTGEIFKRLKSEAGNSKADVAWGGAYSIFMDNLDLFEEYVSVNDKDLPESYRNKAGKITLFCLDGSLLIINTNLVGDIVIEGYQDILNPKLAGKIIMADPSNSSSAFSHLINMLYDIGGDINNPKGWDYVKKLLIINKGKTAGSSGGVPKTVADGEYVVGISNEDNSVNYAKSGGPVKLVYMKEGVGFNPGTMGIVKGAKNLENAKKFVDYMTSKKAQEIYGSQTTVRPIRADVAVGAYMKPLKDIKIADIDLNYVNAHRQEIIDKYKKLFASVNK